MHRSWRSGGSRGIFQPGRQTSCFTDGSLLSGSVLCSWMPSDNHQDQNQYRNQPPGEFITRVLLLVSFSLFPCAYTRLP